MTLKPCPRCKKLIPAGLSYCETCKPIAEKARAEALEHNAAKRMQQYNRRRDPKYLTFYRSKAWKVTSRRKLETVGYKCEAKLQGCTGLAVETHHIKPIQTPEGWDLRLDWENLEAVCTSCHNGRHPERGKRQADDGVIDLRYI
jgi:5-methylcytosine-specific restriction endonuclease McrA